MMVVYSDVKRAYWQPLSLEDYLLVGAVLFRFSGLVDSPLARTARITARTPSNLEKSRLSWSVPVVYRSMKGCTSRPRAR